MSGDRNFSVNSYFRQRGRSLQPRFRFGVGDYADASNWKRWRDGLLSAARATLGESPAAVPLRPKVQVEWQEGGLIKQRVLLDVEDGLSLVALVCRPVKSDRPLPAILCCHGHGSFGKETVMGNRSIAERAAEIEQFRGDYGLKMAEAGFVTIAIDWRGFGERDDRRAPGFHDLNVGRDHCNVHFLQAILLGRTLLGMNVHDGRCALDYLCQLPFVDAKNIGVMGLSLGGTMAMWMSLCDERIGATDIICYSTRFAEFAFHEVNTCGSQLTPGLFALCDIPDLQGLIAPHPLLVEIGTQDDCFRVGDAMSCYGEVEKIYQAAGAPDRLELDLFEGNHRWGGNRSVDFFRRRLGA